MLPTLYASKVAHFYPSRYDAGMGMGIPIIPVSRYPSSHVGGLDFGTDLNRLWWGSSGMSDAYDWIFDYALQFLESDRFDAAVMDFVDEKCDVFDSEDENKFVYSDIHAEFREHIEALITSNLGEVGITVAMFYESCERARTARDINRAVFDKMTAMEDFSTFKRIMVKRNMELQMMALQGGDDSMEMTPSKGDRIMHTISTPMSPEEEKEQLDRALSASMNASLKRDEFDKKIGKIEEADMQEILKNSLMEMELLHRREEMEQRELERAVAESLALEEERLEALQLETQRESKQSEDKEEKGSSASFEEDLGMEDFDAAEIDSAAAPAPSKSGIVGGSIVSDLKANVASSSSSISSSSSSSGDGGGSSSSNGRFNGGGDDSSKGVELDDTTDSKSSSLAPGTGTSIGSLDGEVSASSAAPKKPPKKKKVPSSLSDGGADAKSSLAPPKPLKPLKGLGLSRGSALPPIRAGAGEGTIDDRQLQLQMMESDLAKKKEEAEAAILKGREQMAAQRANEAKLRQELESVTAKSGTKVVDEDEVERRAAQMKAQRDRLVAMKKAERARKVQEEEEKNAKKNDEIKSRLMENAPIDFLKQQKRAEEMEEKEAGYSGPTKEQMEEARRGAMRAALAKRMKMNIAVDEGERLARLQAEQFQELEEKLSEVEALRQDSRQVSSRY